MNILHIDSSIRGDESVSRKLSAAITRHLIGMAPEGRVIYRDLSADPLPQLSPSLIAARNIAPEHQSPELQRDVAVCAAALNEVLLAEIIVIGAPMYNFSIPSQLKSWLDALAVPGLTFRYTASGPEGLLVHKRVIVASARGGLYGPGSRGASAEHQESYLRSFLGFLGITRIETIRAEGVNIDAEHAKNALHAALVQTKQLRSA